MYISLLASAPLAPNVTVYFGEVENDRAGQCKAAIQNWLANEVQTTGTLAQATTRLEAEKYNKALRIRVFDAARKNLIEAKTYRLRNGCNFSPRINALAKKWVRKIFLREETPNSPIEKKPSTNIKETLPKKADSSPPVEPLARASLPPEIPEPIPEKKEVRTSISKPLVEETSRNHLRVLTRFTLAQVNVAFREPRRMGLRDFELPMGGFAEAGLRYRYQFGNQLRYGPDISVQYRRSVGLIARSRNEDSAYPTNLDSLSLRLGGHVSVLYLGLGLARGTFNVDQESKESESIRLPEYEYYGFAPVVGLSIPLGQKMTIGLETELTVAGKFETSQSSSTDIYGLRSTLEVQVAFTKKVRMLAGLVYEQKSIDLGESLLSGGVESRLLGGQLSFAFAN